MIALGWDDDGVYLMCADCWKNLERLQFMATPAEAYVRSQLWRNDHTCDGIKPKRVEQDIVE